jgi:hypothetical protein
MLLDTKKQKKTAAATNKSSSSSREKSYPGMGEGRHAGTGEWGKDSRCRDAG